MGPIWGVPSRKFWILELNSVFSPSTPSKEPGQPEEGRGNLVMVPLLEPHLQVLLFGSLSGVMGNVVRGERGGCGRRSKQISTSFPAPQMYNPQHTHMHTHPGLRFFLLWNWIPKGQTILAVFWLSCSKGLWCLNLEFSHGFNIGSCRSVPYRKPRGFPWAWFSHPAKKTERFRLHCEGLCRKERKLKSKHSLCTIISLDFMCM